MAKSKSDQKITKMTIGPEGLKKELKDCISVREPAGVTGMPGCGKSDIVAQVCAELEHDLLVTHPVCDESIDYKGMPAIIEGKEGKEGAFLPFGHLKRLIDATRPMVCFVDDIGQSARMVQAAIMQLFLNRAINGVAISEHVTFVWASNRAGDRAGADSGLLEPLKSRSVIYNLEADVNDWITWALTSKKDGGGGMPPILCSFLRFREPLLNNFEPSKDMENSCSPRGWARVGKFVNNKMTDLVKYAGCVGAGPAAEFAGFERTWSRLPKMENIILNPDKAEVPEELDVKYALSGALASYANKKNLDGILIYLERIPKEFQVATVKDMIARDESLSESLSYMRWCENNTDVTFG